MYTSTYDHSGDISIIAHTNENYIDRIQKWKQAYQWGDDAGECGKVVWESKKGVQALLVVTEVSTSSPSPASALALLEC